MPDVTIKEYDDSFAHPKGKGEWYFISTHACPVCGRESVVRERREAPKPVDWDDRHEYCDVYDCCDA